MGKSLEFLLIALSFFVLASADDISVNAYNCLKRLKDSQPQSSLANWNFDSSTDVCELKGVDCVKISGTFSLWLDSQGIQGSLPSMIDCVGLDRLDINDNNFRSTLPDNFCETLPSSLTILYMSGNDFIGKLPDLRNCTSLWVLDIRRNHFSGLLPYNFCETLPSSLTTLYMGHNDFIGKLPDLRNCTSLLALDISSNNFSGLLPYNFCETLPSCLTTLYMDGNDFIGKLPDLRSCRSLSVLHISSNNFSGLLPHNFCETLPSSLTTLSMAGNDFIGKLPDLRNCRSLSVLDISFNNFSGLLPYNFCETLPSSLTALYMSGNDFIGKLPDLRNCTSLSDLDISYNNFPGELMYNNMDMRAHHSLLHLGLYIILPIVGISWLILFYYLHNSRKATVESDEDLSNITIFKLLEHLHLKEFDFLDLTNNLDSNLIIGEGGTSKVYKGKLPDGQIVAVKMLHLDNTAITRKTFLRELETLGKLRHHNLVKVLGYYSNLDYTAIILEYMPYGTLESLLHPKHVSYPLRWMYRYNIAVEVAKGLNYLHYECEQPIVHRDLKPSNILLDENFCARIGDFGVARILDQAQSTFSFTWTIGYAAPEIAQGARLSTAADVYSFGIILMELLTGERPCSPRFANASIRDYVVNAILREEAHLIVDKELQVETELLNEMLEVFKLALGCTESFPGKRPEVKMVLARLMFLKDKHVKVRFDKPIEELAREEWLLEDVPLHE